MSATETESGRARGIAAIHISDVSRTFIRAGMEPIPALIPTSLVVEAGEFVSLVGPSGCGKTTLLRLIGGLETPTSGSITVGTRKVVGPHPDVGIMFQRPALLEWYTVEQNVLLPARVAHDLSEKIRSRAHQLLNFTHLEDFAHHYPSELSGGMQQRAAIVRSLVRNPGLLLMDEPFSALDEFTREALADELLRLRDGSSNTVLFVTHSISEAVYLSDRVVVMSPRPGRVLDVIDIDLPRPRNAELRADERFFHLVTQVRRALQSNNSDAQSAEV